MSETITYEGLLREGPYGEADDVLFLGDDDEPFAKTLDEAIEGKQVSVRYWIADKQCSREEAQEDYLKQVIGLAETCFGASYSEATGYLWTTEECKVGGHDLIEEFKSSVGKWLILEIEIH